MTGYSDVDVASSAITAVAITKSDSAAVAATRGLYVGTGGDVKVDMMATGSAITFKNVQSGTVLPIRVIKVYSADTTASDIVGLY